MSSELVIYKNDVLICDRCSTCYFAGAFIKETNFPENKTPFDPLICFPAAINNIREAIKEKRESVKYYEKLLTIDSIETEAKQDYVDSLSDLKNDIRELKRAKIELEFLLESANDDTYLIEDNESLPVWSCIVYT